VSSESFPVPLNFKDSRDHNSNSYIKIFKGKYELEEFYMIGAT